MQSKLVVYGAGAWGTALAAFLSRYCPFLSIVLYSRCSKSAFEMNTMRRNQKYLNSDLLPLSLSITSDFSEAMQGASVVILAVPMHAVRSCLKTLYDLNYSGLIVSASKGFEVQTMLLSSDIYVQEFGDIDLDRFFVLSGPTFALEVLRDLPCSMVIAGTSATPPSFFKSITNCNHCHLEYTQDIVGVQFAGAIKNVVALVCGLSDGVGLGMNARAALITYGFNEMCILGQALGAQISTFCGVGGLGDLLLTATGDLSRNRQVGLLLAQGQSLDKVLKSLHGVSEGVSTTKIIFHLAQKMNVFLPIVSCVYAVLYQDKDPKEALSVLFSKKSF